MTDEQRSAVSPDRPTETRRTKGFGTVTVMPVPMADLRAGDRITGPHGVPVILGGCPVYEVISYQPSPHAPAANNVGDLRVRELSLTDAEAAELVDPSDPDADPREGDFGYPATTLMDLII